MNGIVLGILAVTGLRTLWALCFPTPEETRGEALGVGLVTSFIMVLCYYAWQGFWCAS